MLSITPALRTLPLRTAAPGEQANAKRAVTLAARGDVREVALQAVQSAGDLPAPVPEGGGDKPLPEAVANVAASGDAPAVSVRVWDVNGDGTKDAVIRDESTGASSALLNRGDGVKPKLESSAVQLSAQTGADVDRLAVVGGKTGKTFLAADLQGTGQRQLAVKQGSDWLSLGGSTDAVPAKEAGDSASDTPIQQAEQRYERIVGEFAAIVPANAWDQQQSQAGGSRRYVGFMQMLNGSVDQNPMHAFDANADNLGQLTMMDSFGSQVGAFDPFGVGMNLYVEEGMQGALDNPLAAASGKDSVKAGKVTTGPAPAKPFGGSS
jgi:hypothetical protein